MKDYNLMMNILTFGFTIVSILSLLNLIFIYKFNRLYNYFIKPKADINSKKSFSIFGKDIPPINGDCPSKEELENLD